MKKNQRNILIVLLPIIIILICFLYFLFPRESNRQVLLPQALPVNIETKSKIKVKPLSGEIKKEKKVTLNVLGQKYGVSINEGDSVYEAMKNLQKSKENNFSFNYKEYPSLGIFINEINGIKGDNGEYWIYYINNIEASIGVSNYIIKDGDIINWKLK